MANQLCSVVRLSSNWDRVDGVRVRLVVEAVVNEVGLGLLEVSVTGIDNDGRSSQTWIRRAAT